MVGNFIGTNVTGTSATGFTANGYAGVRLYDGVTNNIIMGNIIGNNRHGGVDIGDVQTNGNQLVANRIGVSLDGSAIPNSSAGVSIHGEVLHTMVGPDNIIANNLVGIEVMGAGSDFNTITRNSIYGNTTSGIDLESSGTNSATSLSGDGANQSLSAPILKEAFTTQISGSACISCTVEIFRSDRNTEGYGQGKSFLASTKVDSDGTFLVVVEEQTVGAYVTATATDANGNTSEFSLSLRVTDPQVKVHNYLPILTR